jgi:hypothetical protein
MNMFKRIVMKVMFNRLERYAMQRSLETEIRAMLKMSPLSESMPYTEALRKLHGEVKLKGCEPFQSIT